MIIRNLMFKSWGETEDKDATVALPPGKINMVIVTGNTERRGKDLRVVNVLLENGTSLQFFMTEIDTYSLQTAVSSYKD